MAYTPNTWAAGDTITAQKLNNMEQGIAAASGGGALYVGVVYNSDAGEVTADKTFAEIEAAYNAGQMIALVMNLGGGYAGLLARYTLDEYVGYTGDIFVIDVNDSVLKDYRIGCDADGWYADLSRFTLTPAQ